MRRVSDAAGGTHSPRLLTRLLWGVTQDLASELQSASELGLELAQETITCLSTPEEEGGGEAEGERIGVWKGALGS